MTAVLGKRRSSELTATDQFCGAGGSSIGAEAAGVKLKLGMNHWKVAIETHSANFPHADHALADISSTDPRRFPSTDILLTSPECTNHSQAKTHRAEADLFDPHGADEAERSRATMMDVPRFAEYHRYEAVVVENVVEVLRWAGFAPWLAYMTNLGYEHQMVSVNSLIAPPAPQSRDRLYVVFWRAGNARPDLDIRPRAWCPTCSEGVAAVQSWRHADVRVGKYRQQYDYRCPRCHGIAYPFAYPAATAIDWSIAAPRIGDRSKALAPATRRRIEVGLRKFGGQFGADDPAAAALARARETGMVPAVADGWLVPLGYGQDEDKAPRHVSQPCATMTSRLETGLAMPPFLTVLRGQSGAHSVAGPLSTVSAGGIHHGLVEPSFIAELRGGGSSARPVTEPLATVCASGNHHGLVTVPAFYVKNYGAAEAAEAMAHPVSEPLGTVTAVDHHSLVVEPFLTSYYGTGGVSSVGEPVPTVTTRDRHGLVAAEARVDDCGFRMLEPDEVGRAMAFPNDYVMVGNKRQRVRQYGNAVVPSVMKMLCERVVATLA